MSDTLAELNRYLAVRGLGQLGDAGLLAQFGFLIRDNDHFRSLLACCDPALRTAMYEALAPNIHGFKVRPLEDYLIEAAQDAEARQLPVITPEGTLERYRPPEVGDSRK